MSGYINQKTTNMLLQLFTNGLLSIHPLSVLQHTLPNPSKLQHRPSVCPLLPSRELPYPLLPFFRFPSAPSTSQLIYPAPCRDNPLLSPSPFDPSSAFSRVIHTHTEQQPMNPCPTPRLLKRPQRIPDLSRRRQRRRRQRSPRDQDPRANGEDLGLRRPA